MSADDFSWENAYLFRPPAELPWNAGHADPDLVRWVETGAVPKGQALEVGPGLGHDAVFLLERGIDVIGVDISPTAIRLTRENASHHGFFGYFQLGDVRRLPIEDAYVDFTYDRGCLQTLPKADQPKALSEIVRVLSLKGIFLLKIHSEKSSSPEGQSRSEIEALVRPFFHIVELKESIFEGPVTIPGYAIRLKKK